MYTDMFAGNLCPFLQFPFDLIDDVVGQFQLLLDDCQLLALELAHLEFAVCGIGAF